MRYNLRKIIFGVLFVLIFILGLIWIYLNYNNQPQLLISEVCPANNGNDEKTSNILDKNGSYCDWVEIYNPSKKTVSLSGFFLQKDNGEKFPLGNFNINPNEYLLVYCSKNGITSSDVSSVKFNIGKTEECVINLYYETTLSDSVKTCKMESGNSFCKNLNGETYISTPTPLVENDTCKIGATPTFSKTSGFYEDEFYLEIFADNNQKIYYTLDGTDPKNSNTRIEYTEQLKISNKKGAENTISAYDPVKIQLNFYEQYVHPPENDDVDKGTVVRACAEGDNGECGMTVTASYFVGLTTADHSNMPVISIVCDPFDLYDEETGIYCLGNVFEEYKQENPDYKYNGSVPANYNQKGREWERECYFEFYESDGSLQVSQDAGMRIQGGWSRADYQKSFRFYARSEYGKNSFDCPFWGENLTGYDGETLSSFKTIVIRNGGNDCNYTKFKDTMFQHMVCDKDFSTQEGRFCVLYINGEYWGFYNLEEDYSQEYFSNHYGVEKDDVITVKNDKLSDGSETNFTDFQQICEFITNNDMSTEENYRKAEKMVDMDNLAQYAGMESYIFNTDWPQNNYGFWRTSKISPDNEYSDGRWRCYLFDCEAAADHYNTKRENTDVIEHIESKENYLFGGMLGSLLKNQEFKDKYVTALCDMANVNFTYFRYRKFLASYQKETSTEMEKYYLRFPTAASTKKYTVPMITRMNNFFFSRAEKIYEMIEEKLGKRQKYTISVKSNGNGYILINGTETENSFEGVYYQGCKITISAVAENGYEFVCWENKDYSSSEITITVNQDENLTAIFKKSIL